VLDIVDRQETGQVDRQKEYQTEQLEEVLVRFDEAWAQLLRRVTAEVKEYPYALPLVQVSLLRLLDRLGPQRMSQLAEHLNVTQSGCTALVDRAIEADLVERDRDPEDRRVVWVRLTATGEAALTDLRRTRARLLARHLRNLEVDDLAALTTLLNRSAARISNEEPLVAVA
jgi:DNA-binding MarR family transcriptional regulator